MAWVKLQHQHQTIRRTNEPYFNHVLAVAEMADIANMLTFEIGLCHDVLEDTSNTPQTLNSTLQSFGYDQTQSEYITTCVVELTDEFTKLRFPLMSKKNRKAKESERLLSIHPDAQTVKYCDLIYNTKWMKKYDKQGFEKYLIKKSRFVEALQAGDAGLRDKALSLMRKELNRFNQN